MGCLLVSVEMGLSLVVSVEMGLSLVASVEMGLTLVGAVANVEKGTVCLWWRQ